MSQSVQTSNTITRGLQQLQALLGAEVKLQNSSHTDSTPGPVTFADGCKKLHTHPGR